MKSADILKNLSYVFPNVKFNTQNNISEEINEFIFNNIDTEYSDNEIEYLPYILKMLEKELSDAIKAFNHVKYLYKEGLISIGELQDHEFNIFEIENQIEDIEYQIKNKRDE